jgi:hypothetical protein
MSEAKMGRKLSEETKKKISESQKLVKHNKASEETKRKIGLKAEQNFKGEGNPFYGKHHTKESNEKNREAHLGRYDGKNNPMYGKNARDYMTKEAKRKHDKKISEANKGNSPFKKKSKEEMVIIKERMSKAKDGFYFGNNNPHAKKVICVETNEIFSTIKEAADNKKMDYRGISQCCNHPKIYKSAKGLHWKFLD